MKDRKETKGLSKKRLKRFVVLAASAVAVLACIWVFRLTSSLTRKGDSLVSVWKGIRDPRALFPNKDRVVILVAGKDYDHDKHDMPSSANSRSDTVMLVCADLANQKLSLVSIPRDTKVIGPDGENHKINKMFQMGGIKLLAKTIEDQFGAKIDYHVILKDLAVKNLVDAVGGVDVDVADEMFYQDSWGALSIDLHKGPQRLNGTQAIGYVRFRKMGDHKIVDGKPIPIPHKTSLEEGDLRRTERQQMLVHALAGEAMRPTNLLHADSLIDTAFEQLDTNLSRTQVLALATLFRGQDFAGGGSATIPGADSTDGGVYYFVPDAERVRLTMKWLVEGDEAAGRQLVRVAVNDVGGNRRQTMSAVSKLGFQAVPGSRKESVHESLVTYRKAAYEGFAREIAASLGITTVQKEVGDARETWLPEIRVTLVK